MAQFDVYTNPSKHTKKAYPYILDIQHELISDIATRMVVPLGDAKQLRNEELKGLTPKVEFEDKNLLILIPQISSIPSNSPRSPPVSPPDCPPKSSQKGLFKNHIPQKPYVH